jgi:hypothetical protein
MSLPALAEHVGVVSLPFPPAILLIRLVGRQEGQPAFERPPGIRDYVRSQLLDLDGSLLSTTRASRHASHRGDKSVVGGRGATMAIRLEVAPAYRQGDGHASNVSDAVTDLLVLPSVKVTCPVKV